LFFTHFLKQNRKAFTMKKSLLFILFFAFLSNLMAQPGNCVGGFFLRITFPDGTEKIVERGYGGFGGSILGPSILEASANMPVVWAYDTTPDSMTSKGIT
jgi:hypothetical protein